MLLAGARAQPRSACLPAATSASSLPCLVPNHAHPPPTPCSHALLWLFDAVHVALDAAFCLCKYATHAVDHWRAAQAEAHGEVRGGGLLRLAAGTLAVWQLGATCSSAGHVRLRRLHIELACGCTAA